MKKIILLLLLSFSVQAQKNINTYKYVIVPNHFDFVKKPDQYQTSSLTKFLFKKYGFNAYLNNENLPSDLASNTCLGLKAVVEESSGMFYTSIKIHLKDCNGLTVFTSNIGKSKHEDYKKAYHEGIRKAFASIEQLHYQYQPSKNQTNLNVSVERNKKLERNIHSENNSATSSILNAVPTDFGYQCFNDKEVLVFELLQTSNPKVFIFKNKNGVLLQKDANLWSAEYYENTMLMVKIYTVRF